MDVAPWWDGLDDIRSPDGVRYIEHLAMLINTSIHIQNKVPVCPARGVVVQVLNDVVCVLLSALPRTKKNLFSIIFVIHRQDITY